MKHFSLQPTLRLFVTLVLIFLSKNLVFAQEPLAPLTKKELIDLCLDPDLKDFPAQILKDFVQKNKIAFLPTHTEIKILNERGVPKLITDQLKFNFASTLVYRVCKFEPTNGIGSSFTGILNNTIEREKWMVQETSNGLLRGKIFEPVPAGPTGPTMEELTNHPHYGYLLIMGDIRDVPNSQKKIVTARLVFVSKVQERMSIASIEKAMDGTELSKQNIAKEIALWSINEVERQIQ